MSDEPIEITDDEKRAILAAREANVPAGDMVSAATRELKRQSEAAGNGDGKPAVANSGNDTVSRSEAQQMVNQALANQRKADARERQMQTIRSSIHDRALKNPALAKAKSRVGHVVKAVEDVLLDKDARPEALEKARTQEEFDKALADLTDEIVKKEIADARALAGVEDDDELSEALDAERDAAVNTSTSRATSGDATPTPETSFENPVFGLGVEQPSQVQLDKAFTDDLSAFAKKHRLDARELQEQLE